MPFTTFHAKAELQKGVQVKATSRNFEITVDEPKELGGTNTGMNPVELTLSALGACQAIVARVYAKKFDIDFDDLWIDVEGDLDTDGFLGKSDVRPGYSDIRFTFHIVTDAPKEKVEGFVAFIEQTCPVADTIMHPVNVSLHDIVIETDKE
ncbi:OsmC family protein [Paraliobacillus salinarum]|uniref:OsmC family protein n=1 Tax=Paraliobacillus salinarum TaxID=1158996 RepID=UPI0015F6BDDB|nr:OsmC family protein [Paraliobacillus salinarum]